MSHYFLLLNLPSDSVSPIPSNFLSNSDSTPSPTPLDLTTYLLPSLVQASTPIPMVPPPPLSFPGPVVPSTDLSTSHSSVPNPSSSLSIPPTSHPMVTRSKHGIYKPKVLHVKLDYSVTEPHSYAIAAKHPQWVATMNSEFQSLRKQHTWSLVPLPSAENIVTCK